MFDLIEFLFELLAHGFEALDLLHYWRFVLSFAAGLTMGVWIFGRFANHVVGVLIAAPVVIASAVLGAIWERNAD